MSTTYVARAPMPPTVEFPPVRPDRAGQHGWPPRHHWPLVAVAGILFGLAVITLVVYGVMASHPGVALPARTLVHGVGIALFTLSGLSLLLAYLVRAHDRAIQAATERGVTEVHGLDPEVRAVDSHLSTIVTRLEAAVGQRVEGLDRRVEAVEQQVDEQAATVAQAATAEAIVAGALSGNGQVRQLHPPNPRQSR